MAIAQGSQVALFVASGQPTVIGVVINAAAPWEVVWQNGNESTVPEAQLLELSVGSFRQAIIDLVGTNPTGDFIGYDIAEVVVGGGAIIRTNQGYQYFAAGVRYLDA
jgi:hypothetical protein